MFIIASLKPFFPHNSDYFLTLKDDLEPNPPTKLHQMKMFKLPACFSEFFKTVCLYKYSLRRFILVALQASSSGEVGEHVSGNFKPGQ